MKICETIPGEVIHAARYKADLEDGYFHDIGYIKENIGRVACVRLVVNRYGDREETFAGNFDVEIVSLSEPKRRHRLGRSIQPGVMRISLRLPEESEEQAQSDFFVSTSGLLLPTKRTTGLIVNEEGYFPTNTDNWDEAAAKLAAISPSRPTVNA